VDLAKSKSMFHERLGKKSQGKILGFLNYLKVDKGTTTMKITASQLRRIIKEEIAKVVREADEGGSSGGDKKAEMKNLMNYYMNKYEEAYEIPDVEKSDSEKFRFMDLMLNIADEVLKDVVFDRDGLSYSEELDRIQDALDALDAIKENRKRKQPIRRR